MKLIFFFLMSVLICDAALARTPAFDSLMDELDLSDTASMDSFRNRLIHVINTEEISISQLRMLLAVLNDMNHTQPTVYFAMVEQELKRLLNELQNAKARNNEEFIFIFKQRYPLAKSQSLRTTILKIPLHIVYYSLTPQKSNSREFSIRKRIPVVQKITAVADSERKPESHAHREFP